MSRKLATTLAIVGGLAVIVAFVRAQDGTTRSVLRSINAPTSSQSSTAARPADSSLEPMPEQDSAAAEEPQSIGSIVSPPQREARRPSLVDRLQKVRGSTTTPESPAAAPRSNSWNGATITGPVDVDPTTVSGPQGGSIGDTSSSAQPLDNSPAFDASTIESNRPSARRPTRAPITSVTDEPNSLPESETAAPLAQSPAAEVASLPDDSRYSNQAPATDYSNQAPAASDYANPSTAGGTLLSSTGPMLHVQTIGPPAIVLGKPATYMITVTNLGQSTAQDIYVRVALPMAVSLEGNDATAGSAQVQNDAPGQQRLVWTIDELGPQGQQTLNVTVTPTENRPFDLVVDWTVRPITTVAQIDVQQPRLEMAIYGPNNIQFGEAAVYTIQLTNPGTGDAENVALDFTYGARRLEQKLVGTIAAGEQTEVSIELTAQQAGELRVNAVATGDGGLRAEANQDVLVRRANLEVEIVGSSLKFAGGVASYKVRVRNTGNASANNVVATIVLPRGATPVGAERVDASGRLAQQIGVLLPGAERVVAVQCQLTAAGENRLEVLASSGEMEASSSFITRVEALADLKLSVTDPQGPTAVGENTVYEIHIANRGTKAADRVTIVGQFSEGIEPTEASGAPAELVPGQVLFQTIPHIAPGEEIVLKIVARGDKAGNHRFRAELSCGSPDTKLVAEETTFFFGDDSAAAPSQPAEAQR